MYECKKKLILQGEELFLRMLKPLILCFYCFIVLMWLVIVSYIHFCCMSRVAGFCTFLLCQLSSKTFWRVISSFVKSQELI